MTSTSNKVLALLLVLLIPLTGAADNGIFSDSGFSDSDNDFSDDEAFVLPDYDSNGEILYEFVLPFIGIMVVLQFALFNALSFTIATDTNPYSSSSGEKAKMRKYSVVLSLVITGMLVPTPYWGMMRTALSGLSFVAVAGFFLVMGMIFYIVLSSDDDGNGGD